MRFLGSLLCAAAVILSGCDSGSERMTAPPTETHGAWLVPSPDVNATPPSMTTEEAPITSSGAVDIAVGTQRKAVAPDQPPSGSAADRFFHVCRAGETVTAIAQKSGVAADELARLNKCAVSTAPGTGTLLLLPRNMDNVATAPDVTVYKVAQGDTFSRIARRFKLSVAALQQINKAKSDNLSIGDTLYVPKTP